MSDRPDDISKEAWEAASRVVGGPDVVVARSVETIVQERIDNPNEILDEILDTYWQPDEYEPNFDFSCPENILFELVGPHDDNPANLDWHNWSFEVCTVIGGKEGVTGAASYDSEYGGFLEYTVQGMIDHPGVAGWYIVENVTGSWHSGDGWETDDDMDFYFERVRPATPDEIKEG